MTFEEVLDQASAMLQRRGRLTCRMLQRHFHLDAEALEDLTFELIKGQRLAIDEDGEVLVWTGEPLAVKPDAQRMADAERRFHTLLPAVMWLLQSQRRVTYRTLIIRLQPRCRRCWRRYGKNSPSDDSPSTRAGKVWSGRGRYQPFLPR